MTAARRATIRCFSFRRIFCRFRSCARRLPKRRRSARLISPVWPPVSGRRAKIYSITGIQFLPFNTLYQLYAACQATPRLIDAAQSFGTIPDLFNYWLTGDMTAEFTNATTTQFIDARTRSWATDLLRILDVPTRILPDVVEPGTIVGRVGTDAHPSLQGIRVVAPASHDTGSAVAAVRAQVFIGRVEHLEAFGHQCAVFFGQENQNQEQGFHLAK